MLPINKVKERLNNKDYQRECKKNQEIAKKVFIEISLHTLGAMPAYKNLRGGGIVQPRGYYDGRYQDRFDNILFSRHARESDTTRNWRMSQYKPLTRSAFGQLSENIIGSIFQDNNYSIQIDDKEDADFILMQPSFDGYDLVTWVAQKGYAHMVNDPNGYFVRMPNYGVGAKYNDIRKPQIYFINGFDVLEKTEDYIIFNKDKYTYYIDKAFIWRFKCTKDGTYYIDEEYNQGYYSHFLGRLPIDVAGGFWNEMGYWESFYSKAIPIADEFVSCYSAEQMVDKEASHPFIQVTQEDCPTCQGSGYDKSKCTKCEDGYKEGCDCAYGYVEHKCSTCNGRKVVDLSPADRFYVPAEQMDKDMVRIISPDTTINTYHHNKNNELYKKLEESLYKYELGDNQSGLAKSYDLEQKDLFFAKIINHLFDNIISNSIRDITAYRHVAVDNSNRIRPLEIGFTIVKPKQTRIRTTLDLLNEYKSVIEASLPLTGVRQAYIDYMDKQYSGDPLVMKKVQMQMKYDILLCVNNQDRLAKLATNSITIYELKLSDNMDNIMDNLIDEKGQDWFVNASLKTIWDNMQPYLADRGIIRDIE